MTAVAMILNDCNRLIDGEPANPDSLNQWLINNNGYANKYLLSWAQVNKLDLSWKGQTSSFDKLRKSFKDGDAVILNVNKGGHWVLMTGIDGTNFLVNDPGSSWKSSYKASEVVKGAIY